MVHVCTALHWHTTQSGELIIQALNVTPFTNKAYLLFASLLDVLCCNPPSALAGALARVSVPRLLVLVGAPAHSKRFACTPIIVCWYRLHQHTINRAELSCVLAHNPPSASAVYPAVENGPRPQVPAGGAVHTLIPMHCKKVSTN